MQSHATVYLTLLVICLSLACDVKAAKILGIFTFIGKSHWFAHKPLLKELARRGHQVTVVTPFPEKDPPPNWENVVVKEHWGDIATDHNHITNPLTTLTWTIHSIVMKIGLQTCETLFQEEGVQKLINTEEKKFDLLIMEYFSHNCFLAFSHKFQIPVVGMTPFEGFVWMSNMVGDPNPFSYVPDAFSAHTNHMQFSERVVNTIAGLYQAILYQYYYVPNADTIVRKHFKDPTMPSISEIGHNTSLLIHLSHPSFGNPRPHLPNVIEVGGMHIEAPKKLPEDLQKFLDESQNGVIYFSMGSFIKSTYFPEEKKEAFLTVFAKLPQRILWKWEQDTMEGQPSNVKLAKWLPQYDILAHKNVKLFITHGGVQSIIESMSIGIPLLAIPITADQKLNAKKAESAGYCVRLDVANITAASFEWAISEVLNNPKYKDRAKLQSVLFNDRPQRPLDTAVYWTEYVLRYNGAHHLRSAALDLALYQYLLLDVIAVLVVGMLFLIVLAGLTFRAVIRLCMWRKLQMNKSSKKKPKTQ